MRYSFLFIGFLLFSIIKIGTNSLYTPWKTTYNETISSFSLYKIKPSEGIRFWETTKDPTIDTASLKQSAWYTDAMKAISLKEYGINYDPQSKIYASPNRQQNLRAYYNNERFTMKPREDKDKWELTLQLNGIYADKKKLYLPSSHPVVTQTGNNIRFDNNGQFITEYINSPEGVRQNFIINNKPEGDPGKLTIQLEAGKDWFINKVAKTELHFAKATMDGFEKKLTYNDLRAWDASGKSIEASFAVENNKINIDVIIKNVLYPVTIDPISTTANWSVESNQAGAQLAWNLASAGDVNGDGYSDVIAGSPLYDNGQTDEGRVFVYHGSATGLSATAAWSAESDIASARMGYCVNTAGDVNGDGYSDVLIGSPYLTNGQTNEGRAYVYYGSASGLLAAAAWTVESNQASAYYGAAVACAGDVNGDGYSDILVGSPNYDNGEADEGMAFVYHGSASGPSLTASWTGEGNQANASYGATQLGLIGTGMASAGDVNGDGYSDIIISAVLYSNGQTNEGRAFVYHGSASGLSLSAAWTYESNQVSAKLGNGVAAAGDVNGDGYGDVIVGAHAYNNGQTAEGQAYVFYGSASGLAASPAWTTESNLTNAQHGCSVASIGDVNNDGYADIIVGELQYTNGQSSEGAALAYFGSATGLPLTANWTVESNVSGALFGCSVASAGDVNGDGYSDVIVGALAYNNGQSSEGGAFVYHGSPFGINNAVATQIEKNLSFTYVGFSVACAGDVNADGYSDVVVGARTYDNGDASEGAAFIYHGSSTGLSNISTTMIESNQTNAYLGNSVAGAGDVNGDGYSDIIVGSILYDNGESDEGNAFVYHGSASGINATFVTRLERNQADAQMGGCVAGAGDVNGDGYSDVIVGAKLYDNGQTNEGLAFVYYGSSSGIGTTVGIQLEKNQANAEFGYSVAGAGDVNGDGYADVIVGSWLYDSGTTDEGAAFIFHGSSSGLSGTSAAQIESNLASVQFGLSVGSAGDVNGDGYSDVIAGAPGYSNGQGLEGAFYIYHGSSTGLTTTPNVLIESNQASAQFGFSVASAGDVNGDGYSDVISGAWQYDNGNTNEGGAFMYQGSPTGISSTLAIQMEVNQDNAFLGYSVASAGDVNGDGFSDVIVGAPNYDNPDTDEGGAFCYLGHAGVGKRNNLRLYNTDLTTPIQQSNYFNPNLFGAGLFVQSPWGRVKARLVWEVKAQGTAFSGTPITNSTSYYSSQPSFTDLGIGGTELKYQVQKQGKQTKIRARVEYSKATAITGQVYGPWKYPPGYTMGAYGMNAVPLPLQLITFTGQFINKDDVQLQWTTINEINMQQFIIERSEDGIHFTATGTLPAKGTIAGSADYFFMDRNVKVDLLYYRLKLKEQNGDISYSHIITLKRSKKTIGFIAPNPVAMYTDAILTIPYTGDKTVRIRVFNTSGQIMLEKDAILHNSRNEIRLTTKGLSPGIYIVSVLGKTIKESYHLTVQ